MDSDGEDDEAEEERLLAELRNAASASNSPLRPPAMSRGIPIPPNRGSISHAMSPLRHGLELEARSVSEEDEEELFARALIEDHQISRTPVLKPVRTLEERFRGLASESNGIRTAFAGTPTSMDEETEQLLAILKKASGEDPIPEENFSLGTSAQTNNENAETIRRLKALVKHLEARVDHEKRKAEEALERAANLYAQRFALGIICAASVPSLAMALIAHTYDLHEWEARSDALGVLLVSIAVLSIIAVSLWKKARAQMARIEPVPQIKTGISSNEVAKLSTASKVESKVVSNHHSISSTALRKRPKRQAKTKAEIVL